MYILQICTIPVKFCIIVYIMQGVLLPVVNTLGSDYTGKNKTKIKSKEIEVEVQ